MIFAAAIIGIALQSPMPSFVLERQQPCPDAKYVYPSGSGYALYYIPLQKAPYFAFFDANGRGIKTMLSGAQNHNDQPIGVIDGRPLMNHYARYDVARNPSYISDETTVTLENGGTFVAHPANEKPISAPDVNESTPFAFCRTTQTLAVLNPGAGNNQLLLYGPTGRIAEKRVVYDKGDLPPLDASMCFWDPNTLITCLAISNPQPRSFAVGRTQGATNTIDLCAIRITDGKVKSLVHIKDPYGYNHATFGMVAPRRDRMCVLPSKKIAFLGDDVLYIFAPTS